MAIFTLEDCVASRSPGRLLRRIDKIMSTYVASKFERLDLSFQQWVALKVVCDGIVGSAGELARDLGITTGATTRMIDVLEARGFLARDRNARDRRVVGLTVTPAGKKAVIDLQSHVVAVWNEALADFTQDEAEMLVSLLIRLLAAAERITGGAMDIEETAE